MSERIVTDVERVEDTQLVNTTAGGSAPRKRIANAKAAYNILDTLVDGYTLLDANRARIQGMYDGNRPYNSAELERLGQSHRCNVNFREMEAIIDMNTAAAWSLHNDVATLIETQMAYGVQDPNDLEDWGEIISEEYTRTIFSWNGFYYNLDLALHEQFKLGLGFAMWPDELDWRSKSYKSGALMVPTMTKCDIDEIDLVYVRDEIPLVKLYDQTADRQAAENMGWNVGAIKDALVSTYLRETGTTDDATQTSPWESMQQALKNGDAAAQCIEFLGLQVIHIFVRELKYPYKISHMIIEDVEMPEKPVFLYEKRERFGAMRNCLWVLPYNYGDGYLRGAKGLGHRSFPHCEFSNRFLGRIFDGAMLSATLMIQPRTGIDRTKLGIVRLGGDVTLIPSEVQVIQQSFAPQIGQLIGLRGLSKEILQNNTGVYRPFSEINSSDNVPKTAQQVRSEENREARFERNHVDFFYVQWQLWHEETFRRLTNKDLLKSEIQDLPGQKEARDFVKRCVDRGVPEEVLLDSKNYKIRVSRALGMGSPSVKMDITNQLLNVSGSMDEVSRLRTMREWAAVRVGYWNVDKFFPKESKDIVKSNAGSLATLENNSFMDGKPVPVGVDQPEMIHLAVHIPFIGQIYEAVVQGKMDPMTGVQVFSIALQHAGEHVANMGRDRFRAAQTQRAQAMLKELAKLLLELQKRAKQAVEQSAAELDNAAAAEEQRSQGLPPEMQLKMQELQGKLQIMQMEAEGRNQMRAMKLGEQLEISKQKAAADVQLKGQESLAELERKAKELDAKIDLMRRQQA